MLESLRRHIMMQAQGGGDPIPGNNQIIYKSGTGSALDLSNICNATLINQEIVGEFIIATFDSDVTAIRNYSSLQMTYIDFPQTCTTFGRIAFDNSYNLYRIIFRASNYTFGNYCFGPFLSGETVVTFYAPIPQIRPSRAFNQSFNRVIIEVPAGCAEAYRNSPYWSNYTIIEMNN